MPLKISSFKNVVVLTGAGISAESGISTFRDSNGLWEKHRIEDVATPEAFDRDPRLVWRFYSMRRRDAAKAAPNAAHLALAKFAAEARKNGTNFTLVSQNVDMLHERATSQAGDGDVAELLPYAMHGSLSCSRCTSCEQVYKDLNAWIDDSGAVRPQPIDIRLPPSPIRSKCELTPILREEISFNSEGLPRSPCCQANGLLRPHIVWFGEMPLYMQQIEEALSSADLFVTIGSSGQVYPAAGFLEQAKFAGAITACLNKETLPQQAVVDFYIAGPATRTVPALFGA